jgi:cold shock CspA family protein
MGRSHETYNKKELRTKLEKKRKEKEQKRAKKKGEGKKSSFEDMIAYVNEFGVISSTPPDPAKKTVVTAESIELRIIKNSPENTPDILRKGVVTFFDESRGFGFISDMESNQRVFVHVNSLLEPIAENNVVVYKIVSGPKGPSAIKVKLYKE